MDYLEKHQVKAKSYLEKHPIKEDWITKEITEEAIRYAHDFAKHLAKEQDEEDEDEDGKVSVSLTTSQLRKFFGAVKSLQIAGVSQSQTDLVMLKPKLAYAEGRVKQNKPGVDSYRISDFLEVMTEAIDLVIKSQCETEMERSFKNFVNFFEAVVAYHKVYGKDK